VTTLVRTISYYTQLLSCLSSRASPLVATKNEDGKIRCNIDTGIQREHTLCMMSGLDIAGDEQVVEHGNHIMQIFWRQRKFRQGLVDTKH